VEDPKEFLRNAKRPLKNGRYTVSFTLQNGERGDMPAVVRDGFLEIVEAPYPLAHAIEAAYTPASDKEFYAAIQVYLDDLQRGVKEGRTRGVVNGSAGRCVWDIYPGYSGVFNDTHPDDDDDDDQALRLEALCLAENLLLEAPEFETLKDARRQLDPAEREKVMKAGAVWHHAPGDKPSPAVWKAVVRGKTWYCCNTHRAYRACSSLRDAIKAFEFVQSTS